MGRISVEDVKVVWLNTIAKHRAKYKILDANSLFTDFIKELELLEEEEDEQ